MVVFTPLAKVHVQVEVRWVWVGDHLSYGAWGFKIVAFL